MTTLEASGALLTAIAHDDVGRVRGLFEEQASWAETWTALQASAIYEAESVAAWLLEASLPLDLEARDDGGRTALHHAAASGNVAIVRRLLDKGASMSSRTGERTFGRVGDVSFGADLALVGGQTALHCAAANARLDATRFLLGRGADRAALDDDGATPRDCCLRAGAVVAGSLSPERRAVAELLDSTPLPSLETLRVQARAALLARRERLTRTRATAAILKKNLTTTTTASPQKKNDDDAGPTPLGLD